MPTVHPRHDRSEPRTVIIDADRRVQQSLAEVLNLTGRIRVVGAAGDVRQGLELVEREHPDVVIVDPHLPDLAAGEAFLSGVRLAWPATQIIVTGWGDWSEQPAVAARAAAFVSKSGSPEEFVTAVVDACCGAVEALGPLLGRAESA
jgi:two-component system, NarL family, nitrate/nitrite response regulator NarL